MRLDAADRDELLALPGAGPFGPEDRPMKEYVALPAEWGGDPSAAAPWIERSVAHTAGLPPKKPKAKN